MNFKDLTSSIITFAGTSLLFSLLESRRVRIERGETREQTTERDQQATKAFQDILRAVNTDSYSDLIANGGFSTLGIALETLNDGPSPSAMVPPLLNAYRSFSTFCAFSAAIQSSPFAALNMAPGTTAPLPALPITPAFQANQVSSIPSVPSIPAPESANNAVTGNVDPIEMKATLKK